MIDSRKYEQEELENECGFCGYECERTYCSNDCKKAYESEN